MNSVVEEQTRTQIEWRGRDKDVAEFISLEGFIEVVGGIPADRVVPIGMSLLVRQFIMDAARRRKAELGASLFPADANEGETA